MNKKLFPRLWVPLFSFGITLVLFLLADACYGIFPCGKNSIVWCDMEQQAVPLLMQMKQLLQNGETLAFSPYAAGGMHFYAVFFFFLSNPFSLLALVTDIPADQLVTLLIVPKLALAAGTAAFWFRSRIPALPAPLQILLGVMYGCSGFGLYYYQNLMWLDIMLMLPLLMFSMRRLLKRADPVPFVLVLSAMMVLCFYLGYMIVLFVVLYMAVSVRTTVPAARQGIIARRFLLGGLFAGCLTAAVWLPCLIQVMQSARGVSVIEVLKSSYLFNHIGDKTALLGCTCIGFAALPLLWQKQTPRISSRRRDRRIFVLLAAAVLLDPINIMWHGGSYQAFPLRWGMIPILLMLTLAGKQLATQFEEADAAEYSKLQTVLLLGGSIAAAAGFGIYLLIQQKENIYSYVNTLWISTPNALWLLPFLLLLTTVYVLVMVLRQNRRLSVRAVTILLSAVFLGEFAFQFHCCIGAAANPDPLYAQTVSAENAYTPAEDTARLKMTKKYAHANMLGALGFPTLAHYTSLTREDFLGGMKRLGYSSYWMEVSSHGGTLLSDALWNVRYQLGLRGDFPSWTEPVWTDGTLSVAESSLTLPSALLCDAEPEQLRTLPAGSRADVQEYLAEMLLGCEDAVTRYAPTALNNVTLTVNENGETVCTRKDPEQEGEIRYSVFVPEHQVLYFDLYAQNGIALGAESNDAVAVRCNGKTVDERYPEDNSNGLMTVCEPEAEYVVISVRVLHDFTCESFGLFGMKPERLAEAAAEAEGAELHYHRGVYSADVKTDRPQTLLLSAAYDEGFSAEINGQPAAVLRLNDCQLGVTLPAGENHVVLRYRIPGLRIGLLLGGAALLAALTLWLLRRKLSGRVLAFAGRAAALILQGVYLLLLLVIYLLPMILWLLGTVSSWLPSGE